MTILCRTALILFGWLALSGSLLGQPVAVIPKTDEPLSLAGHMAFYRDSSYNQSVSQVIHHRFQPVESPVPNFGFTSTGKHAHPIWLKFRLRNPTNVPQPLAAKIRFWCFDTLQLFVTQHDSLRAQSPIIGWKTPVSQRPVANRHYYLPFTVQPGQEVTVYLWVLKQRGTQIIPITVLKQSAIQDHVERGYIFWGGIAYSLGFVCLMSLLFFLTTRDRIYWKYAICLLCLLGFFTINDGFINQYAVNWQFWLPRQNVYFLFPLLLYYSQLLFVRSFLHLDMTEPIARFWHRTSTVVLGCGLFCLLILTIEKFVTLSVPAELWLMRVFTLFYWFPMPVIGAYIALNILRQYNRQAAWLYLVALTPFYVLNFGQVLANFGLMPTYLPMADYMYYAGAALFEVLVLSVGLAFRYKMVRDDNEHLIRERVLQQQLTYEAQVQTLALQNTSLVEKERIARDLHDNVGAQLSFIVTTLLHTIRQGENQPMLNAQNWAKTLRSVVDYTREAIKMLRETIWAIHQETFTLAEFEDRLNQYVNRYFQQDNGLLVDVRIDGYMTQPLTSVQVLNLFRIVQEALSNVVKHSQATRVDVRLQARPDGLHHLTIRDNGRGLSWGTGDPHNDHYGLQNMQRRAEELGGQFRIYSEKGTVVEVAM